MLRTGEVHGHTREGNPLGVLRIAEPGHEDRVLRNAKRLHAALDEIDVQIHESAHLDRATERNLAIALGEVQVPERELRTLDKDRIKDPRPGGEILNVLVSTVLARWSGARGLARDPVEFRAGEVSEDGAVRKRRQ